MNPPDRHDPDSGQLREELPRPRTGLTRLLDTLAVVWGRERRERWRSRTITQVAGQLRGSGGRVVVQEEGGARWSMTLPPTQGNGPSR